MNLLHTKCIAHVSLYQSANAWRRHCSFIHLTAVLNILVVRYGFEGNCKHDSLRDSRTYSCHVSRFRCTCEWLVKNRLATLLMLVKQIFGDRHRSRVITEHSIQANLDFVILESLLYNYYCPICRNI